MAEQRIAATNYRDKLRKARERKNWSEHEAAAQMESVVENRASYHDIEAFDDELTYCYSLNQIVEICKILDIHPRDLFCDDRMAGFSISDVAQKIKAFCSRKKISVAEFENIVGWEVESCLRNAANALEQWNIDCLIDVTRELGIDWHEVVAGL